MQKLAVFAVSIVRCGSDSTSTEFSIHSIMDTANDHRIAREAKSAGSRGQWMFVDASSSHSGAESPGKRVSATLTHDEIMHVNEMSA